MERCFSFLLFLVGLEVNYKSVRLVGKASLAVGLLQILFTFVIGYGIASFLGFSVIEAVYISIALTFSSTIIVVKLLSEKKQINSLYGRISIGLLLVQDFVAIFILMALAGMQAGGVYVFLVVAVVYRFGFSLEIGGFLAGIALANASEHYQIASRVRSLRDFFILIFFAILGSSLLFSNLSGVVLAVVVFSLFVLIGNPLVVLVVMGLMGYRKHTSFLTGITIAQISEFSLVLAVLGMKLGHINNTIVSLITAVGIITITLSTYAVVHANYLYRAGRRLLSVFERRIAVRELSFARDVSKPIIIVGFGRTGQSVAMHLKKEDLLVIDFDPEIIHALGKSGYVFMFGDAVDDGIFEQVDLSKTRLLISTSPTLEDNMSLLEIVKRHNIEFRSTDAPLLKAILRAEDDTIADLLYKAGADYVLLPHFTSGHYLGSIIAGDIELKTLESARRRKRMMLRRKDTESVSFVLEGPLHTKGEVKNLQKFM